MSKKMSDYTGTQSEQYDNKLRADLYACMLGLRELCADIHEAEEREDEDEIEVLILKTLDLVPLTVKAYLDCVEGQRNV